jgi:ribonuclease P protein subunit POP4
MGDKNLILFGTFIGIPVEIIKSASRKLIGLRGKIVDETKNLLVLETEKGIKRIQKNGNTFLFGLESGEKIEVDGKKIMFRPEERPKKIRS